MIHFNTLEGAEERSKTKALSLIEEEEVIRILNNKEFNKEEKDQIQRFVNHYQNLCHYMAYTHGLWCTERDMSDNVDFFELNFKLK